MMKNCICLFSILFLFACNNKPKGATKSDGSIANAIMQSSAHDLDGCYYYILNGDSANLYLNVKNNEVHGILEYKRHEKDNNTGTILGKYKDSLIIANYTFQSEGTSSTREMVFKVGKGELIEGYGEIQMKGDSVKFKDISQLEFQKESPFIKKNCP